jgi:4'-phosphopantetheinyl transferase
VTPSPFTAPGPGEVRVWWAELPDGGLGPDGALGDPDDPDDPDGADVGALARHLDEPTRARLRRMLRLEDRDRGVLAHSLARRALAAAVGGDPRDVRLAVSCASCGSHEHGKPYVRGVSGAPEFNLTHSGRVVAVALAPAGLPVGVDVEARRSMDWAPLRRNVFGDDEWAAGDAAADPERERFATWARKEAAVKASGHGLSLGLSKVRTRPGPGGWAASLPCGVGNVTGWDLDTTPAHCGAVAVLLEGPGADAVRAPLVRRVAVSPGEE